MKITYSAPLSVPLSGQNTALYGKPVFIVACDLRVTASITESPDQTIDEMNEGPLIAYVEAELLSYLKKKGDKYKQTAHSVDISSDIDKNTSLSYHSAVIVALTAALLEFYIQKEPEIETVNRLAYQIHKKYFKQSLGFYTSCSCLGGIQYYRKEFEFLKSLSKLNFKFSDSIQENLYVIFTKTTSSFQDSVEKIKKIYNKDPLGTESIFNQIEKTTKRMVIAVAQESSESFKTALLKTKQLNAALVNGENEELSLEYSHDKKLYPFKLSETGLTRS